MASSRPPTPVATEFPVTKNTEKAPQKSNQQVIEETSENEKSYDEIKDRFLKRRLKANEICDSLGIERNLDAEDVLAEPTPEIFYSDKYKFLFCTIAKSGCTSIKRWMLDLEYPNIRGSEHVVADKFIHIKRVDNTTEIQRKFDQYTKIILVRHPFHRLLSCYRDKLESMDSLLYGKVSEFIHRKYSQNGNSNRIQFSEFISFLLDHSHPYTDDIHWDSYLDACRPCNIEYDYIAKLETVNQDMKYVSNKLNINLPFPSGNNATVHVDWTKVSKYYSEVSPEKVNDLYHHFKKDFDIFSYDPPPQFYS